MGAKTEYFTEEEVLGHQSRGDLWLIIHGKVYDVTGFLDDHPGGQEIIMEHAGTDATGSFEDVGHSPSARRQLDALYIGDIVEDTDPRWNFKKERKTPSKAPVFIAGALAIAGFGILIMQKLSTTQ